jgi:4-amino-4-deoxy-L-arabinose transferase-like glycosyltransferase
MSRLVKKALGDLWAQCGGPGYLLLLLAAALLFNGARGLWAPDEGRYVAGALEMLRRHDFVGIFLNDDTSHFAKPPMTYWALAAALKAFGQSEFVARLPNALALVAAAGLLLPAGRLLTPRIPALPMILYSTLWLPFLGAGFVTTDTIGTMFTTLAGVAFLYLEAGIAPRRAAIAMWVGFGLAFLTKGPPMLLALPVFIGWLAWRRNWPALREMLLSAGIPLFAVIGFSWYLVAVHRFPGLLEYFIGAEVEGRLASPEFQRNSSWWGSLAVYAPTIVVGTLPWLPAWLAFARRATFARPLAEPVDRLLLAWIGLPMVVFLLARSRLPLYLLPLFAPFAVWLARRMEPAVAAMRPERAGLALVAVLALLVGVKFGIAQLSPEGYDSRAAATQVEKLAAGPIDDVVYVDERAMWALSFYLGVQVRESWARRTLDEPSYQPHRRLEEFLGPDESPPGRIYVVNGRSTSEFAAAVLAHGRCPVELGGDDQVVVYRARLSAAGNCAPSDGDGVTNGT